MQTAKLGRTNNQVVSKAQPTFAVKHRSNVQQWFQIDVTSDPSNQIVSSSVQTQTPHCWHMFEHLLLEVLANRIERSKSCPWGLGSKTNSQNLRASTEAKSVVHNSVAIPSWVLLGDLGANEPWPPQTDSREQNRCTFHLPCCAWSWPGNDTHGRELTNTAQTLIVLFFLLLLKTKNVFNSGSVSERRWDEAAVARKDPKLLLPVVLT
jgi:hypothetical protein